MQQIAGAALKVGGALFNAWAGSRAAAKIASEEASKNRDLLLQNARRRNESALENAQNRLQMTQAMGAFNAAANRQAGAGAVTGASNSRVSMQRQANNMAMANVAGQMAAAAGARQDKLLDEQANLTAQGYDAKIRRIEGQRDAMQQAGSAVSSLGDSLMTSGLKQ